MDVIMFQLSYFVRYMGAMAFLQVFMEAKSNVVPKNSKMSLMFESTAHSTSTSRKKHVKSDKNTRTMT